MKLSTLVVVILLSIFLRYETAFSQKNYIGPVHKSITDKVKEKKQSKNISEKISKETSKKEVKKLFPFKKRVKLSLEDAIRLALENNINFKIKNLNTKISWKSVIKEESVFDNSISAGVSKSSSRIEQTNPTARNNYSGSSKFEIANSKKLRNGDNLQWKNSLNQSQGSNYSTGFDINYTHPLKRGKGRTITELSLNKSKFSYLQSLFEYEALAQKTVADVEKAYWNIVLTKKEIQIYEKSLEVAYRYLQELKEKIKVGSIAENELASARAEIANRKEKLINIKSKLKESKLNFINLLNLPFERKWEIDIRLTDRPKLPEEKKYDVKNVISKSLKIVPELKVADLSLKIGKLNIIQTKNGILPRLDFFINLGKSGYSDSFSSSFGELSGKSYSSTAGLNFDLNYHRRKEITEHEISNINYEILNLSVKNLINLVIIDVRSAIIEIDRTYNQVYASTSTRKERKINYETEKEKYNIGKSTLYNVSQSERDYIESKINVEQARINTINALVDFRLKNGTILESRGIRIMEDLK